MSYLLAAQRLFAAADAVYPQFATHNAWTLAAIQHLAPAEARYEFQRLCGMGERLYALAQQTTPGLRPVRVYAPVGSDQELLPYLIRRLLENGANTSFVHQFLDRATPVEVLLADPLEALTHWLRQDSLCPAEPATPARAVSAMSVDC